MYALTFLAFSLAGTAFLFVLLLIQGALPGGPGDKYLTTPMTPDLAGLLGPDAQKYAGKPWGDLPGELKTRIIQDMKSKYGDDYARVIKLYFEQLADKK